MNTQTLWFAGKRFEPDPNSGMYLLNDLLAAAMQARLINEPRPPNEYLRTAEGRAELERAQRRHIGSDLITTNHRAGTHAVRTLAIAYGRWLVPDIRRPEEFEVPPDLAGWAVYLIRDNTCGGEWAGISPDPVAVLRNIRTNYPCAEICGVTATKIRGLE